MIINRIGAEFEYEGTTHVIGAPIVGTPENNLLRAYPGVFHCPGWMSMCLFNRWPFCLFLLMEGARAGKNKSNGHA